MKKIFKVLRHSDPEGRRIFRHLNILRPNGLRMTVIAVLMFLSGSVLCLAVDSTKSSAITGNAGIVVDNSAKSLVIPAASSVISAKAGPHTGHSQELGIHIDDQAWARLKAENLALRNNNAALIQQFNDIFNDRQAILNKLKVVLNENGDLKERISAAQPKRQHKSQLPEDVILRKKLVAAKLELMATKDKDEGLKEEVANMHYNLGTVLQSQNKYDDAIREFELDLMVNPDDAEARDALQFIASKTGAPFKIYLISKLLSYVAVT